MTPYWKTTGFYTHVLIDKPSEVSTDDSVWAKRTVPANVLTAISAKMRKIENPFILNYTYFKKICRFNLSNAILPDSTKKFPIFS